MTQRQNQIQTQKQLQHINDMWHRVLFSLELFEYAAGEIGGYPAHYPLQQIIPELENEQLLREAEERFKSRDLAERDELIQLWLRAFRRGLTNKDFDGTSDAPILLKDYLEWFAARYEFQWGRVDDYVVSILKALLGEPYEKVVHSMPEQLQGRDSALGEPGDKFSINDVVRTLGIAATLVDKREARFDNDGQVEVQRYSHKRGHFLRGLERFVAGFSQDLCRITDTEFGTLLHGAIECLVRMDSGLTHNEPRRGWTFSKRLDRSV